MTPKQTFGFVKTKGVVLESGRTGFRAFVVRHFQELLPRASDQRAATSLENAGLSGSDRTSALP